MDTNQRNELLASLNAAYGSLAGLRALLVTHKDEIEQFGSPVTPMDEAQGAINRFRKRLLDAPQTPVKPVEPVKPVDPVPPVEPPQTRPAFTIDPRFSAVQLNSTQRRWYEHLMQIIRGGSASMRTLMTGGTSELIGFTIKDYVLALAFALDATGDAALLNEIVDVMDVLRKRQDFVIRSSKDAAFMGSLYGLVTYLTQINCEFDARYAEANAFWRGRLVAMAATNVPSDDLTHAYAASIETGWYLWLITGDERFRKDAEGKRDEFLRGVTYLPSGAAQWEHRPFFARAKAGNSIQRTTYARYTLQSLVILHQLGLTSVPMESLVKAVLHIVTPNKTISYYLDGKDVESPAKLVGSNWGLVARFDASGEILKRMTTAVEGSSIFIPATLLTR